MRGRVVKDIPFHELIHHGSELSIFFADERDQISSEIKHLIVKIFLCHHDGFDRRNIRLDFVEMSINTIESLVYLLEFLVYLLESLVYLLESLVYLLETIINRPRKGLKDIENILIRRLMIHTSGYVIARGTA